MNKIIAQTVNTFYDKFLNEAKNDKLAINFLKQKGIKDYDRQMEIIGTLKHDVPNIRNGKGKFILGALRCYFDNQLSNTSDILAFNKAIGYIFKGGHQDNYDENLNGKSVDELVITFKDIAKGDLENDVARSNARKFTGKSEYTVIPIEDFDDAEKYCEYTAWCVTHGQEHFDGYVCNGLKRFYFCLKNGFKDVQKAPGENVPVDEYGLSMISVLVDNIDGGSVDRITTRWNHEYNGENNSMLCTAEQLEDIINLPFYKTFPPYTREEMHEKGIILFDEVQDMLDNGETPEKIFKNKNINKFDDYLIVYLNKKYNYIDKNNHLLSSVWFDNAFAYHEGYAQVQRNDKVGYIDKKGNIIHDEWFDYGRPFTNGAAAIGIDKKYNFIDGNSSYISKNQWFDNVWDFKGKHARVSLGSKYNFIDKDGKYIYSQWFDDAADFNDGFAWICINDKFNFIDETGKYISPDIWFESAYSFESKIARIKLNGKWTFIDNEGNIQDKIHTDEIESFTNGYAKIKENGKVNLIDKNYDIISKDMWFDRIGFFSCGCAFVVLNKKYNFIDEKGRLLSDIWFDDVCSFNESSVNRGIVTHVKQGGKWNLMRTDGSLVCDKWYDNIWKLFISDRFYAVRENDKENYIDDNGKPLCKDMWFDDIYHFSEGVAKVDANRKYNYIDETGNILWKGKWFDNAQDFK